MIADRSKEDRNLNQGNPETEHSTSIKIKTLPTAESEPDESFPKMTPLVSDNKKKHSQSRAPRENIESSSYNGRLGTETITDRLETDINHLSTDSTLQNNVQTTSESDIYIALQMVLQNQKNFEEEMTKKLEKTIQNSQAIRKDIEDLSQKGLELQIEMLKQGKEQIMNRNMQLVHELEKLKSNSTLDFDHSDFQPYQFSLPFSDPSCRPSQDQANKRVIPTAAASKIKRAYIPHHNTYPYPGAKAHHAKKLSNTAIEDKMSSTQFIQTESEVLQYSNSPKQKLHQEPESKKEIIQSVKNDQIMIDNEEKKSEEKKSAEMENYDDLLEEKPPVFIRNNTADPFLKRAEKNLTDFKEEPLEKEAKNGQQPMENESQTADLATNKDSTGMIKLPDHHQTPKLSSIQEESIKQEESQIKLNVEKQNANPSSQGNERNMSDLVKLSKDESKPGSKDQSKNESKELSKNESKEQSKTEQDIPSTVFDTQNNVPARPNVNPKQIHIIGFDNLSQEISQEGDIVSHDRTPSLKILSLTQHNEQNTSAVFPGQDASKRSSYGKKQTKMSESGGSDLKNSDLLKMDKTKGSQQELEEILPEIQKAKSTEPNRIEPFKRKEVKRQTFGLILPNNLSNQLQQQNQHQESPQLKPNITKDPPLGRYDTPKLESLNEEDAVPKARESLFKKENREKMADLCAVESIPKQNFLSPRKNENEVSEILSELVDKAGDSVGSKDELENLEFGGKFDSTPPLENWFYAASRPAQLSDLISSADFLKYPRKSIISKQIDTSNPNKYLIECHLDFEGNEKSLMLILKESTSEETSFQVAAEEQIRFEDLQKALKHINYRDSLPSTITLKSVKTYANMIRYVIMPFIGVILSQKNKNSLI